MGGLFSISMFVYQMVLLGHEVIAMVVFFVEGVTQLLIQNGRLQKKSQIPTWSANMATLGFYNQYLSNKNLEKTPWNNHHETILQDGEAALELPIPPQLVPTGGRL